MLVFLGGGCERTEAEFRALLREARFAVTRVIPIKTASWWNTESARGSEDTLG
jgi:hypothetical protein